MLFYKHILGLFQNIGKVVVQVVELSIFSGPAAMQKVFQNKIPTSLRKQTINKVWSVPLSLYRNLWKERSREAASFRCRKKINCCSFTEFFCQIVKLQNVPFFYFLHTRCGGEEWAWVAETSLHFKNINLILSHERFSWKHLEQSEIRSKSCFYKVWIWL